MTRKIPTVRIAKPHGRPIQLRYTCPTEGREIRISTGTVDEFEAIDRKQKLEAKLLLGLDAKPRRRAKGSKTMMWEDFRERYTDLHLSTLREKSAVDAESRLDVAERILKPRTLGDVADSESLHYLQQQLLVGAESRFNRPRSPVTASNYMLVVSGPILAPYPARALVVGASTGRIVARSLDRQAVYRAVVVGQRAARARHPCGDAEECDRGSDSAAARVREAVTADA
jgi:hypothetical protein